MPSDQTVGNEVSVHDLGDRDATQRSQGPGIDQTSGLEPPQSLAHQWEIAGEPPKIGERVTIESWKDVFLQDARSPSGRNLATETYRKYVLLFKQLEAFAKNKGLRYVDQLDVAALTAFRGRGRTAHSHHRRNWSG